MPGGAGDSDLRLVADTRDARFARGRLVVRDHTSARSRHDVAAPSAAHHRDRRCSSWVVALAAAWHGLRAPQPQDLAGPVAVVRYARLAADERRAVVVAAARDVGRPAATRDRRAPFLAALGPALLDLRLHYVWVLTRGGIVRGSLHREGREARRATNFDARRQRGELTANAKRGAHRSSSPPAGGPRSRSCGRTCSLRRRISLRGPR